jgi:ribonuclease D
VIELARRGPTRESDLESLRGIPKGLQAGLLAAILHARGLPTSQQPEALEREFDTPQIQLLASLLNVVLNDWCARHHLAANQVATMSDLKALIRARQPKGEPAATPLHSGWRRDFVLPELEAFLSGERTLHVADVNANHPIRVTPHAAP